MLSEFRGRHVLLLQGPSSPFFLRLAGHLERVGATVTKVNFNAGDWFYYHTKPHVAYRGTREAWPRFLTELVGRLRIDSLMLFGDCRPLHRDAVRTARDLGVEVYVFEEGYVRPDYITLERDGVNGNSRMSRDPGFYRAFPPTPAPSLPPLPGTFWKTAWYCTLYAWALTLFWWRYPHYQHHRNQNAPWQLFIWTRSGILKLIRQFRDKKVDQLIATGRIVPYFFVPLQVNFDSQIGHSRFASVAEFIQYVVQSFAEHAPSECRLLLKHHPFDRPYQNYQKLVDELRSKYGLGDRLIYADVINLPTALRKARGTVVINSTVGLSSAHHQTPVKCLGNAIYDIPGLTSSQSLAEFWKKPARVDHDLYLRFRAWLIANNQINGSIWLDIFPSSAEATAPEQFATS